MANEDGGHGTQKIGVGCRAEEMLRLSLARCQRLALGRSGRRLSTRQAAQMETEVMDCLRAIPDGLGLGNIVSGGRVKVRVARRDVRVHCADFS